MTLPRLLFLAAVLTIGAATTSEAQTRWIVDHEQSDLAFTVSIGGALANGAFEDWDAEIIFDPDNPEQGSVEIVVAMASVDIDAAQAQSAIGNADWLAISDHPVATFTGQGFDIEPDGTFTLPGQLTLKALTMPLVLTGDLVIDGDRATAEIEGTIQRLDHAVGSDDPAVSARIQVIATVIAHQGQ